MIFVHDEKYIENISKRRVPYRHSLKCVRICVPPSTSPPSHHHTCFILCENIYFFLPKRDYRFLLSIASNVNAMKTGAHTLTLIIRSQFLSLSLAVAFSSRSHKTYCKSEYQVAYILYSHYSSRLVSFAVCETFIWEISFDVLDVSRVSMTFTLVRTCCDYQFVCIERSINVMPK